MELKKSQLKKLLKLWIVSSVVYKEILFYTSMIQQSYASADKAAIERIVKGRWGYWILKGFVGLITAITGLTSIIASWNLITQGYGLQSLIASSVYLSIFLLFSLFFIFFMAVFQSTALSAPEVFEPLNYLNLSREEISIILYLTVFRIFDIPILLTGLVVFLTSLIVSMNLLYMFLTVFSFVITMILVIAIVVKISFRYFRGFIKPEISKKKAIFKTLLLFFYTIVFSLLYLVPTILASYIQDFTYSVMNLSYTYKLIYSALPIISFATLTSFLIVPSAVPLEFLLVSLLSVLITILVAFHLFRTIIKDITKIVFTPIKLEEEKIRFKHNITIKRRGKIRTLLIKDIKLAYRNPNYSLSLFSGPALLLIYFILWKVGNFSISFIFTITQVFVLFVLLLAPLSIGMEGEGLGALLTLPVKEKDILISKTIIYMLAYIFYALTAIAILFSLNVLNVFGYNLIVSTLGITVAIYRIIRKTWNALKKGESIEKFRVNIAYIGYIILLLMVYYLPNIITLIVYVTMPKLSLQALIAYLIIQVFYLLELYRLFKLNKNT